MIAMILLACASAAQNPEPYVLEDADVWGTSVLRGPLPAERPPVPAPIRPSGWRVLAGGEDAARGALVACLAGELRPEVWPEAVRPAGAVAAAATWLELGRAELRLARLPGASTLLVNGQPFHGDPERRGLAGVPIALREGEIELVVIYAPEGFELELLAPRTRVVIEERAVFYPDRATRETGTWSFLDLGLPIFNASTEALSQLHVHYGHAVPELDGFRPFLEEWMDGGSIPPLSLLTRSIPFGTWEKLPDTVDAKVALVPVCIYGSGDADADRRVLRVPLAEPGAAPTPQPRDAEPPPDSPAWLFRHALVLVRGTAGSELEDAALLARARFDQQRLWYATGRVPGIMTDRDLLAEVELRGADVWRSELPSSRHGPVVLYGNEETNAAWKRLLGAAPGLAARRGRVELDRRMHDGERTAGFAVLPRVGAEKEGLRVLVLFDARLAGARVGAALDPLALVEPRASGLLRAE